MSGARRRGGPAGAALGFVLAFAAVLLALGDRGPSAGLRPTVRGAQEPKAAAVSRLVPPSAVAAGESPTPDAAPEERRDGPAAPPVEGNASAPAPLGAVLWGTVTEPDGSPVADAWVSTPAAGGERHVVRSSAEGRYTMGPLPPGPRRVTASWHLHHDDEVELVAAAEELLRQDFVLRPKQRIVVRVVTSEGEPTMPLVRGMARFEAVPVATREDPGDTLTDVEGSLNNPFGIGQFWGWGYVGVPNLGGGMLGCVFLDEEPPAWLSFVACHQVLAKQRIDSSTGEVTFVLDPEDFLALRAGARGRVVDAATGEPIAATVSLGEYSYPPFGQGGAVGDDGLFSIEGALPGRQVLTVRAPGRARVVRQVTLRLGEVLEVGDVPLLPAVSLSGHVRRDTGEPLDAVVSCGRFDPATGEVHSAHGVKWTSGDDGTFAIGELEPAVYLLRCPGLRARPPHPSDPSLMSLPVRVDASRGSVEGIELVLRETTVVTLVAEDAAEPWPVATAFDGTGLPVRSVSPGRWETETPLHLPPGDYTLEVERDGVLLERRALVVGDEPRRLVLALE